MATVELQNLTKHYPQKGGSQTAVAGINLSVRDGEFMVLVGPSGCGKSTTLRMIAGLEGISAGAVTIGGEVVNDRLPKDRGIAMVFQNYALYPHMTVFENMAFGLKLSGTPREEIRERVNEAVQILGLEALLERKPAALSGGQRQRVAVGRAIVRKPRVFLFDEPLSNLDAKMRVSMRTEIARLHARLGATMIYVTHDQTEAMTMGDRICVMHQGRIMQVAEPLGIYHRPANQFTAGFIGTPPMNFFSGAVVTVDGTPHFEIAGQSVRVPLPAATELAGRPTGFAAILGVRPEDIRPAGPCETVQLGATVELVEPMGAETFLHLKAGDRTLIMRVPPEETHASGDDMAIVFNRARLHVFAADTGKSLLPSTVS